METNGETYYFNLFGSPSVRRNAEKSIPIGKTLPDQLFAYLAYRCCRDHKTLISREELGELIRPGVDSDSQRASLNQALYMLRQTLRQEQLDHLLMDDSPNDIRLNQ